jgi:hypothetical protein
MLVCTENAIGAEDAKLGRRSAAAKTHATILLRFVLKLSMCNLHRDKR